MIFTAFVDTTKAADPVLTIKLTDSTPVQYCNGPVPFAESLIVEGNFILPGMKISINEGYNEGEDTLVYSGSIGNIVGTWYSLQGYLILKGDANTTVDNYRDAIKSVRYKNNKLIPTLGTRKITISLDDADYYIGTGHFYRFVSKSGIKWTDAEGEAKSDQMMYYGLRGYLATITSMFENSFIQSKTKGVGWIGASDAAKEGEWRWVTGPEGLNGGLLFWKGTGYQAKMNNPAGAYGPVNGAYHNWNKWDQGVSSSLPSSTWEPNNTGPNGTTGPNADPGEDYAHITVFPNNANDSYKWNDLPNSGGSGDYIPAGYLIEFGGTADDPKVDLSATLSLQVNSILFKTGTIDPICEGSSVALNQPDLNTPVATYSWTPTTGLSDPLIANPVANPIITAEYTVIGTRGKCVSQPTIFKVSVNPKPVVFLGKDTTICNPLNIILNAGQFANYKWLPTNETTSSINVTKNGTYSVTVTDLNTCKGTDSISISFVDKPKLNLSRLDTLICGKKSDILDITSDKGTLSALRTVDGALFYNMNVIVPDFGTYGFKIKVTDQFSCFSDSLIQLGFHKTPTIVLSVDSTKCYGYNLDVKYSGDADATSNFTWIFGGDTIKQGIGISANTVPLGINRSTRDLKLVVTDQGCPNDKTLHNIKVIPNLKLVVLDSLGCEPFTAQFKANNTETVIYDWKFGDGNVKTGSTITNPSNTYQHAGYYPVSLKVTTPAGCSNEVKIDSMVHVAPIPDVAFSLSSLDCLEPGVHELTYAGLVGTSNDTYTWELFNLDPSEIATKPGTTQGPLRFDLKTKPQATIGLNVLSSFGCSSLAGSITLKRKPDFTIDAAPLAGCVPFTPALSGMIIPTDTKDKVDFTWDFGGGSTGTGSSVPHTFNEPDKSYTVTLTGKSSITGCSNVVVGNDLLKTYSQPKAAFSMDHKIVYNDKPDVKFTDISTGNPTSWNWNFGDVATSVLQNPTYHFTKMGHQQVVFNVTNAEGCTDEHIDTVLVAFDRLFPPNGFSPNASNSIDREFLLNAEGITPEGYHFTVLSRWNDIVFEAKDEIKGWDGKMKNGTYAPAGAYVWILNFADFLGRKHQQTGTVTLIY